MEDETNVAPSAETSANEPMSFDSALAHLNAQDEAPEQTEPAASEAPEGAEPDVEADQAEPSTDEAEAEPDAETEPELVLHGNAKTRLRDGREVTISELKKRFDEAEEYRAKQAEFDAKRQEFEAQQAQIAAQQNFFTNTFQQAKAVLEANFPPKPDENLLKTGDTFTYMEQKAHYDAAVAKWRQLDHAQKLQAQKAETEKAEGHKAYLKSQFEQLTERAPEFKDDSFGKSFRSDAIKVATEHYGATPEQVGNVSDAWMILMAKDAIAYRKLQDAKPKAMEKAKDAPPVSKVQAPGRRIEPAERQAQVVKEGLDRLRKSGSFDDALAILNSQ